MTPKNGGTPLPPSPICLPREYQKAAEFVLEVEKALEASGWSASQRKRLRYLHLIWKAREQGRDPQFEQFGTFWRRPGSQPPTPTDLVMAQWRRRSPITPDERKRRKVPWSSNEAARQRAKRWRQERDERRQQLS